MNGKHIDVLAFGPHPDDVEIYCAGALLMLKRAGRSIGVADLTHGELSTRGTPALRREETALATRLLGLDTRVNLNLHDGDIQNTLENRIAVAKVIRRLRPRTVFLPWSRDRHPDHEAASVLVRGAIFQSGLATLRIMHHNRPLDAWRPSRVFFYPQHEEQHPTFFVDISDVIEQKLEAIRAYASQFDMASLDDSGPKTYISAPNFLESIIARWRRQGFLIGKTYAEGFIPDGAIELPLATIAED